MSSLTTNPSAGRKSSATPMRALVFDGSLRVGMLPRPVPGEGELLVRMSSCAISRADLDIVQGRRSVEVSPVVLGHQYVGEVVDAGASRGSGWVGKRVVSYLRPGCGACPSCRTNQRWLCIGDQGKATGLGLLDGGFAEYVIAPVASVVEVPAEVDDDEASFAHPVAVALAAIDRVVGEPPQRVLVVGDGNMGLLVTLMLHLAGHTVSVFGRHPSRRELLWKSGISFSGVQDERDRGRLSIDDGYSREAYATVFECSGRSSGFELALRSIRARGRMVLLSDQSGEAGYDLRAVLDRELEIHGIQGGSLPDALDYLAARRLDLLPLLDRRVELQDGATAFQQAARRGTLKILLQAGRGGAR